MIAVIAIAACVYVYMNVCMSACVCMCIGMSVCWLLEGGQSPCDGERSLRGKGLGKYLVKYLGWRPPQPNIRSASGQLLVMQTRLVMQMSGRTSIFVK